VIGNWHRSRVAGFPSLLALLGATRVRHLGHAAPTEIYAKLGRAFE
jgi:hypothetical protein